MDKQFEEVLCDLTLEALLQNKKDVYFNILSNGMKYVLTTRDRILVRRVEPIQLRIGDIIVYRRQDNKFTVHRVLGKKFDGKQYVLSAKPDAYSQIDPPVYAEQIIGKVIAIKKPELMIRLDTATGSFVAWLIYSLSKPKLRGQCLMLPILGSARNIIKSFRRI